MKRLKCKSCVTNQPTTIAVRLTACPGTGGSRGDWRPGTDCNDPQKIIPPDRMAIPPDRMIVSPDRMAIPPDRMIVSPDRMAIPPNRMAIPPDRMIVSPNRLMIFPE